MTVKRIVLIRPGETDWNVQGRWQGWVASPLNAHGRAQAAALARYVRHIGLAALYTSDLRRALQTAAYLAEPLGFAPIPDERLRERKIGEWQGLTQDEMNAWYPEQWAALQADPENFQIPNGESRQQVRARMTAALNDILAQDKGETVGILSHSTAIRLLLAEIIPGFQPSTLDVSNSAVTTIRRGENDRWIIVAANDTMHLEGLETRPFAELGDSEYDPHDR